MSADDFEKQLAGQRLRQIPPEWRSAILEAARAAVPAPEPSRSESVWLRLREWLWPAPQAWAGLAAVWLIILALHLTGSHSPATTALNRRSASAPETILAVKEQWRLRAELLADPADLPQASPVRRPRSALRSLIVVV